MGEGDLTVDQRGEEEAGEEEGDEIDFKKIGKTVSLCLSARTALFLPYKVSTTCILLFRISPHLFPQILIYSGHHHRQPTVTTTSTSV